MNTTDTIAAVSTAPAAAMRAIIRISGPDAFAAVPIADLPHRVAIDMPLDIGLAAPIPATITAFHGPNSVTGDDLVEISLPGSPLLVSQLLRYLFARGIRQAEPGEFTARAFFNGKIDLAAAEGVVATIGASNRHELNAARGLLAGELARRLTPIFDELVGLLARAEADVDFSDDDVAELDSTARSSAIAAVASELQRLIDNAPRLERLAHEPRLVLAGRPNAGKSTLLNALAGSERAVVSSTVGTTRDALSVRIALPGGFVTLVDVAGLADASTTDLSSIDAQMDARARAEIERADAVLLVRDCTGGSEPISMPRPVAMTIATKADLAVDLTAECLVSAKTGDGMSALRDRLNAIAFPSSSAAGEMGNSVTLNARHVSEMRSAIDALHTAQCATGVELVAAELRRAVDHIGRVLGSISPDDVLGRIFSAFCIGK